MFKAFINAFKVKELRDKILFTKDALDAFLKRLA